MSPTSSPIRAFLLISSCLAALVAAPPAAASGPTSCFVDASTPSCVFSCGLGDTIYVQAWGSTPAPVTGTASCGGQTASCTTYYYAAYGYGYCNQESASATVLFSDAGTCTMAGPAVGWDQVYCASYPNDGTLVSYEVPSSTTPGVGGGAVETPDVYTPQVPGASSPAVATPPTCWLQPCTGSTPVGPVGTPPIPRTCAPLGLLCVGPASSIPILPAQDVGPLCGTLAVACVPGQTLLAEGALETPGVPATKVLGATSTPVPGVLDPITTPVVGVAVYRSQIGTPTVPQVGFTQVGPFTVDGPLPVTVCDTPCDVPYLYGNGEVRAEVRVGDQTYSVPVTV